MPEILKDVPRWALVLASGMFVILIGAVGTYFMAEVQAHSTSDKQQDARLAVHEERLDWHDKAYDRVDDKLDRILERLSK